MTCTCGHNEDQHHPVSHECLVCECDRFEEPETDYDKEYWGDE